MLLPLETTMRGDGMKNAFEPWIGQAVVVQLTLGRIKLSLRGTLLMDRSKTLLVRPEAGSDVEIPKTNVLAIEEARRHCPIYHTLLFEKNSIKRVPTTMSSPAQENVNAKIDGTPSEPALIKPRRPLPLIKSQCCVPQN
jgi:hypothetical protein